MFIIGHFTCNRFAIISVAALCAAVGVATGNPAYIGVDLICVIGATVAVLNGTSQQRTHNLEQKRAAKEAKEAALRATRATKDAADFGGAPTALAVIGLGLAILAAVAVSQNTAPNEAALTAAPEPQPAFAPPVQLGVGATQVTATPTTSAREAAETDAEEKGEKPLAREDADPNRRFNEMNQSPPPSYERRMAGCDGRADEIEAWDCLIDRLRKHGIEDSQAGVDELLREIRDAKECQRLLVETVKAACLAHFSN